jgi:RNA polymerase sigma-70 factor (ECF subfamily)
MSMLSDSDPSDEALAERARGGDEEAFGILFERHAPALRRNVRRQLPSLLRRKVTESDVIQMAYLRVHQHLDGFSDRGAGSFRAWLDRIVENQVADILRRYVRAAKRSIDLEISGPQPLSGARLPGREPTASQVAGGAELLRKIEVSMERLPEDYRRVLRLVQGEGLTLAAAGERLDRSASATKKLYARALAMLNRFVREIEDRGGG